MHIKFASKQYKKGALAIEVLVATSVILVTVLAATGVAQKSLSVSKQSVQFSQASFLLEEGAEAIRSIRDNESLDFDTLTGNTRCLKFENNQWSLTTNCLTYGYTGIFRRTVNFAWVTRNPSTHDICPPPPSAPCAETDTKTFYATVNVDWGGQFSKSLSFYITKIF